MRTLLAAAALLLVLGAAPAGAASLPDIEDEVMCIECGTALNVSEAPSAEREREFIRRRIAEGMTKAEIKAALVREYGRDVLAVPRSPASWLVPAALALAALAGLALAARRWRHATSPDRAAAPDELDPDDARRLERDMAGYDP